MRIAAPPESRGRRADLPPPLILRAIASLAKTRIIGGSDSVPLAPLCFNYLLPTVSLEFLPDPNCRLAEVLSLRNSLNVLGICKVNFLLTLNYSQQLNP